MKDKFTIQVRLDNENSPRLFFINNKYNLNIMELL